MKFKSGSANPPVTSSTLRVTSSNPRVISSNPRVTSSNPRVFSQWKSSLKISSFPKILSLKSFGNSWGNSYVQFLVIISCFTFTLFHGYGRLQQETKWVSINFERQDLISTRKVTVSLPSHPDVFEFWIFHLFNTKLFAVRPKYLNLNYYRQTL